MRFYVQDLTRDKREALLEWLQGEDIEPNDVADNGRFTVYGNMISGHKFIYGEDGAPCFRNGKLATYHFAQPQKNPLPEILDTK